MGLNIDELIDDLQHDFEEMLEEFSEITGTRSLDCDPPSTVSTISESSDPNIPMIASTHVQIPPTVNYWNAFIFLDRTNSPPKSTAAPSTPSFPAHTKLPLAQLIYEQCLGSEGDVDNLPSSSLIPTCYKLCLRSEGDLDDRRPQISTNKMPGYGIMASCGIPHHSIHFLPSLPDGESICPPLQNYFTIFVVQFSQEVLPD